MPISRASAPVIRSGFPRPGSLSGDQKLQEFIHDLLAIMGDVRLLWIPGLSDTTTTTEKSRNARVFTYDATIAARKSTLGSGLTLDFDGTDDEADVPDADNLSFGNGVTDQALSIVALVKPDTVAGTDIILSKMDITTGATKQEWEWYRGGTGLMLRLWDDSAGSETARIGRSAATQFTAGTRRLVAVTYDGSGSEIGCNIYGDGALQTLVTQKSGTYVAMENTASLVRLGFRQGAAAGEDFWDGAIDMVALCAKALNAEENWAIKTLINAFYGLSL